MASGTGLIDQATARWDVEALAAAEVDEQRFFPLCDRAEPRHGLRAPWASRWPALRTASWFPAVGDGVASNVGSDCVDPTRIALNVGTSAALRVVTRDQPPLPRGLWTYHRCLGSGARALARLDPDHRGCNRPPNHVSRRARGDESRGRAARPGGTQSSSGSVISPPAHRGDLRAQHRPSHSVPTSARTPAPAGREGMI